MIIIKSVEEFNKLENDLLAITIGNFDGVHLGHRDFLNTIKKDCQKTKAKLLVVTFVPHPSQILRPKSCFLINSYSERRELLESCGVDYLFEIDFDRDFSTLSPESFLDKFIFSHKNIFKIFLGYDFSFGANKSGTHSLVKKICEKKNINLILQSEFKLDGIQISSTTVRKFIQEGDVENSNKLLGRKFFLSGRVIKGQGRGRQIGFPTANMEFSRESVIPSLGVYITETSIGGMNYHSVTNIGNNPTFNSGNEIHLETHLLNFSRDIYGEVVRVSFIKKLRNEVKFKSVNELIFQINSDLEKVREYFKIHF